MLRLGFEAEEYNTEREGLPCRVVVHLYLQNTTLEGPLILQLVPQENVAAAGPLPTAALRGANASSKGM